MTTMYILIAYCTYVVYFFCPNYELTKEITFATHLHIGSIIILGELLKIANMTVFFAVIFKVADQRMAAFHVTLLATLYNISYLFHKIYIYKLMELVGL